jgi:hypothetical protein
MAGALDGGSAAMETRRLRALQQPSQVERLLEAYISRTGVLPKDSFQIRDSKALPSALQKLVMRAASEGRVWSCWANNFEFWLFTCEMSLTMSRERREPVLLVNRYAESGELQDAGAWMRNPEGRWERCGD